MKLSIWIMASTLLAAPVFANHGEESQGEEKAAAMNNRCIQGDGKGCALCRHVKLPEKAPPGRSTVDNDFRNGSLFTGDDGKTYTYTVHFTGLGTINGKNYVDVPNLTDEKGDRVCPEGYAYRVFKAAR
jgi:hypothetical protein